MEKEAGQEKSYKSAVDGVVFTVDSYANGIAIGQRKLEVDEDWREEYALRLEKEIEPPGRLRSRYTLQRNSSFADLEEQLRRLAQQGILRSSVIYLGTASDPFHPFAGRFDPAMRFLEIFQRYTPGLLVVQTRSPLIVIALPVLRKLGHHVAVTIALETSLEETVSQYTPGLPRVEDRIRAATTLRRFGVEVTLQAAPVLPYGDWRADAGKFAELLVEHGDFIHVQSLSDGSEKLERCLRHSQVAKRLARERKFHWLRPDAALPLLKAIELRAPEKLLAPDRRALLERQLSIFAA